MTGSVLWTRSELVASVALLVLVLLARGMANRLVRRGQLSADVRRRWIVHIRTTAVLTLVFGAAAIWAAELRTVALSVAAVAVAFTIATKELLSCMSGAMLRASARAFSIGDRIQVADYRGDVIDIRALSTTILEVDDTTHRRTGRAITLPNSLFLDKATLNETFAASYVLSVLTVPLEKGVPWEEAERHLLEAATEECASFVEAAKEEISKTSRRKGLDVPIVEPTVSLVLDKPGETRLMLRFPTPVRRSNRVGQAILRRYLRNAPVAAAEASAASAAPPATAAEASPGTGPKPAAPVPGDREPVAAPDDAIPSGGTKWRSS